MAEVITLDERNAPAQFVGGILDEGKALPKGVLMRVGGRMMLAETPNANRRRYPRKLWEHVLGLDEVKAALSERRMYGELDHPTDRRETSLKEASHVMTTMRLEPTNEVYGEFDILDTPMGRIAEALFLAKCTPGVSTRAEGSVRAGEGGISDVVTENYKFKTVDIVATPSTPGAYPGVLAESVSDHEQRLCGALLPLIESLGDSAAVHRAFGILNECTDPSIREQAQSALDRRTAPEPQPQERGAVMADTTPGPLTEAAIQSQLDEQAAQYDDRIRTLQESLLTEQQARQGVEARLQGAHELIESQADRIRVLEGKYGDGYSIKEMDGKFCVYEGDKKLKAFDDKGDAEDYVESLKESTQVKLAAAEQLIEELLAERDAGHQLIEAAVGMLRSQGQELSASKKLLEGFVNSKRIADRDAAVNECLGKLGEDHPRHAQIAEQLRLEESADRVNASFAGMQSLLEGASFGGGSGQREPLPAGPLNENKSDQPLDEGAGHTNSFAAAVVANVTGG